MNGDPKSLKKICVKSVTRLVQNKIIDEDLHETLLERINFLYLEWRSKFPKKTRGRPPRPINKAMPCQRIGCDRMALSGEKYCCRDHAPYGNWKA